MEPVCRYDGSISSPTHKGNMDVRITSYFTNIHLKNPANAVNFAQLVAQKRVEKGTTCEQTNLKPAVSPSCSPDDPLLNIFGEKWSSDPSYIDFTFRFLGSRATN